MATKAAEDAFIKPAYQPSEFKSQHEVDEFMKCADPKDGYMHFIKNHFWIQHPTQGALQFKPFDYQEQMVSNMHNNRLTVSLLSRQLGKCVGKDTLIKVRNPLTLDEYEIKIGEWYSILDELFGNCQLTKKEKQDLLLFKMKPFLME